jgi:hypothetical protein
MALHQPQFKGLFAAEEMEQRSHHEISGIQNQDRIGAILTNAFNDSGQTGPAAFGGIIAGCFPREINVWRKPQKMGMQVIGVDNGQAFGFGLTNGDR